MKMRPTNAPAALLLALATVSIALPADLRSLSVRAIDKINGLIPQVPTLESYLPVAAAAGTKASPGDPQKLWLADISNGDKWVTAFKDAMKNPPKTAPPLPQAQGGFLDQYDISFKDDTLDKILNGKFDDSDIPKWGFNRRTDRVREVQIKVKNKDNAIPYQGAVSLEGPNQGKVFICLQCVSEFDDGKSTRPTPIAFEDLMTLMLAYAADPQAFNAKKLGEQALTNAVQKLETIVRSGIVNRVTKFTIGYAYQKQKWTDKKVAHDIAPNTDEWKALISTNNGSLGPKLLGTNSKGLGGKGNVDKITIRAQNDQGQDRYYMVTKLTH